MSTLKLRADSPGRRSRLTAGPSPLGSRRYSNVQRADSRRVHLFQVTVAPG